jgi:pantothenate kinase-related protein Tda10
MRKYPQGTTFKLLTVSVADQFAKNIYNSWSYINDDEEKVYAQFRALNYQSQVSSIVNAYYRLFNKDLYQTLYTKLSDSELTTITNIISNKPSGIQK